jgi:16S rRNA (guanine527-N7)-methyltransferase
MSPKTEAPQGSDHRQTPVSPDQLEARLRDGVAALGLDVPGGFYKDVLAYVQLLLKWNRAYNLTAVRDPAKIVTRHVLDSLTVVPYLCGNRVLDVGTGPGLPGIVLALARPELEYVLLDSNGKKCRFLTQAVTELGLDNTTVVHRRVEEYRPTRAFGTVISRAFSSLAVMLERAGVFVRDDGCILAMKGIYPVVELQELPAGYRVEQVIPLTVPQLEGERYLVVLKRDIGAESG